jgi:hypothetical protein
MLATLRADHGDFSLHLSFPPQDMGLRPLESELPAYHGTFASLHQEFDSRLQGVTAPHHALWRELGVKMTVAENLRW